QFGYQWSAPAGNIISGAQNPQVTVNAPGIYTLTVRDSVNYCVASDSVHVLANDDVITAIAYATDTLNCAVSSVALHSEGSAQGQDISYLWTTANGLILSGADGPSPLVGAPGVYTLLLTNTATGCTSTDTVHVQSNYTTLSLHIPAPEPLTCSSPSQTVVAQFQPINAPYSFSWSTPDGNILNGQNEPQITVDAPGMYIATATHLLSHCAVSDTALVGLEVGTPVAAASALGQLSCVQTAVVLDASASSNGPEFAYVWAGQTPIEGDSTLIAVVNAPGVYSLTVWNTLTGCSATISLTVASDTMPPTADAGPDRTLTCFAPQQTLSAGSMATGLSYVWTAPDQSQTAGPQIIANTPGAYVLTAQNPANGCSAADTAWVDANQAPPALLALTPLPLTCASPSTPLVLQGDAQHLTLSWSTPDGLILSGANTSEPVVGAPGTYSLTATDTLNGCSQTLQTLVAQDTAPPLLSVAPPAMLTCAQTQQVLAAQNGASGVFEYVWTGPDGQQAGNALQILASEPGVYVLQAMNVANGCAASAQVVLLQDTDPPVVDAGPDQTLNCSMTQLTLQGAATGSGSLSFAWSTPDGWILSGADTPNPIIAAPGEYVLLVTQTTNGCTASAIAQVSRDDDQPLVQILPAGTLTCAITQLTLTGLADNGPSIAYQWSTPDGLILAGAQSLSAVVGAPGVYTLLASNSENGCTNSQSATIIADTIAPALYISEPDTLTCAVQMVQIDAAVSGDSLIYQWTGAGIVSGAGTSKPTVSQPGVYTLTALNPLNGCTSVFDVAVAADQNPPILQAQTPPALTCDQPQATLQIQTQPTGLPYAYAWSTSNGLILSGAQSPSPQVGAGGLYFVSVQNLQNGCTATLDLSVESDQTPPTALIAPPAPITCLVTSATLDASASTPGASYWWTAGGGGQIAGPSDQPTAEVVSAGIYTLTLTQLSNGCTAQSFVQVQADQNPPIVSIAPPEVLNCLTSSVALQASAQATGPLSYAWATPNGLIDGDPQSPTAQVSGPGDYYLTVVNSANGCSASAMVVVQRDITPPLAKAGPDGVLHCKQTEWTLKGESDAGPRAFLWTAPDGQTFGSPQINITAPGAYTLLVTNTLNGCTATSVASIAYVPPPQFTPTLWQPDCLYPYGDIDFGAIGGGQPPFAYSWNGGASFGPVSSVEKLPPGAYDLIVRDAYGCTAAAEAVFVLPDPLLLSIVAPQTIDLGDSIRLSAISNRPVAQWTWTSAEPLSCTDCPAPWAAPQRSATYQAQAADASGCTAEVSVLLRVNRRRRIYAPNVFAPEIQGLNTRFTLFGKGVESIESLQIYDRWGSQIYAVQGLAINDPTQGWDGTYRGQTLSPGVYVWIARIRFADDETETLSGDVTLLR
ncbi:MAG: gliding motility-associated C-terminal domain-containing protein, partial [Saprospiraceae bacterium]